MGAEALSRSCRLLAALAMALGCTTVAATGRPTPWRNRLRPRVPPRAAVESAVAA